MPDLADGESIEMKGSGAKPYVLKNIGGVYSCTCPAWRNQSVAIERRTCKHLRKLRGDEAEEARRRRRPARPGRSKAAEAATRPAGPPLLLAETWDNAADLRRLVDEREARRRRGRTGTASSSSRGSATCSTPPTGSSPGCPDVPLDGELWIGRKAFQRTVEHRPPAGQDRPVEGGHASSSSTPRRSTGPFERRLEFLADTLGRKPLAARRRTTRTTVPRARPPARRAGPGRGAGRRGADAPPAGLGLRGRAGRRRC